MEVELICVDVPGVKIVLSDLPVLIGRSQTAHVRLDGADLAEFQCMIERDEGSLSVADIAGGLGTSVNGHRIRRASLMPGDTLRVGKNDFMVEYEREEELVVS
jgi:pSer/pThr/pTyr-binding forkhead associated (FHA) protein